MSSPTCDARGVPLMAYYKPFEGVLPNTHVFDYLSLDVHLVPWDDAHTLLGAYTQNNQGIDANLWLKFDLNDLIDSGFSLDEHPNVLEHADGRLFGVVDREKEEFYCECSDGSRVSSVARTIARYGTKPETQTQSQPNRQHAQPSTKSKRQTTEDVRLSTLDAQRKAWVDIRFSWAVLGTALAGSWALVASFSSLPVWLCWLPLVGNILIYLLIEKALK